ncbi:MULTISPECIES: DMT family transporter [Aerosakkonema]|uniref:DMT family transporter n=1 Tax=Aerosakkonema TaxID=1246629 RepID=UPI0035B8A191
MSSWIYIILAIILEVIGTSCMKLSEGFSKILPSVLMFVFYGLCLIILTLAIKKIELGVVYAVWSGLGTALIATIGIFLLNESASPLKIGAILLIIIGVVILKLNPEPVAVGEAGMGVGESGMNVKIEATEPVKIEEPLPPIQDTSLLIPQVPIKSPELENL